jgi:hypothetical protein
VSEGWLDLLQWPAMGVTVAAAAALIVLQLALAALNIRGAWKNNADAPAGHGVRRAAVVTPPGESQ